MLLRPTKEQLLPRAYTYDALGRPTERQSAQQERELITDHFGYNQRSELTSATLDCAPYAYAYDNIGKTADGCKAGWTCAKHAPGGRYGSQPGNNEFNEKKTCKNK